MKNKILVLLIGLLVVLVRVSAQVPGDNRSLTGFRSVNEAAEMTKEILKASGHKANFTIMEAKVPNAVAVLRQGKRYILYNPQFMHAITKATGTRWAAVSVLAHEIGHHLYGKNKPNGMATELEADEYSGFVLEKLGATLADAQAAMKFLATSRATTTHPAKGERVRSIAMGYKKAGGVVSDEELEVPAVVAVPERTYTLTSTTVNTIASIRFNSSPGKEFYVTKRMNVVKMEDEEIKLIARVSRSDSENYPYIIYDDTGFRLYVDRSGTIVDRKGNPVGTMRAIVE
jgi:hypothetical protein